MLAKILVIDDSELVRSALRHGLAERGFQVETAEDGVDALLLLRGDRYDAVILDLNMPRLSGFDAFTLMAEPMAGTPTPVIFLTAEDDAWHVQTARRLGAAGFFSKSTPIPRLVDAIGRIVADGRVAWVDDLSTVIRAPQVAAPAPLRRAS